MFRRAGSSFDLKNIREYLPSDDPRRIDWKLMGRADRLYVKEFYEEERDGVCLVVDVSGSIGVFGLEIARTLAASLSWTLAALGLPTSLWAFSDHVLRRMERPRGGASPAPVAAFFRDLPTGGGTDLVGALAAAKKTSRFRRVLVVSDFLDPAFTPAACPFARSFFLRLHRDFEEMEPGTGEVELIDPETGARLRTPWDERAKSDYRSREEFLDAGFGEAVARGSWYRRIAPDSDRGSLYWRIIGALYG
jgi:uncharacterized protein (DUF58 family)